MLNGVHTYSEKLTNFAKTASALLLLYTFILKFHMLIEQAVIHRILHLHLHS